MGGAGAGAAAGDENFSGMGGIYPAVSLVKRGSHSIDATHGFADRLWSDGLLERGAAKNRLGRVREGHPAAFAAREGANSGRASVEGEGRGVDEGVAACSGS